jgi:hypothetical protein
MGESRRRRSLGAASLVMAMVTALLSIAAGLGEAHGGQPAAQQGEVRASQDADDVHRRQDIGRHRQMAVAHEAAAACLESGKSEKACHETLRDACKGIAVGRYCGMRHAH